MTTLPPDPGDDPTPPAIRTTVHYCEPGNGHTMHHIMHMGRVAGWYVLVARFDRLYTHGPYATREEAEEAES